METQVMHLMQLMLQEKSESCQKSSPYQVAYDALLNQKFDETISRSPKLLGFLAQVTGLLIGEESEDEDEEGDNSSSDTEKSVSFFSRDVLEKIPNLAIDNERYFVKQFFSTVLPEYLKDNEIDWKQAVLPKASLERLVDLIDHGKQITSRIDSAAILLFCLYSDQDKCDHLKKTQRESLREFFSDQNQALPKVVFKGQVIWRSLLLDSLKVIREVVFSGQGDEASKQLRLDVREVVESLKLPLSTESMLTLLVDGIFSKDPLANNTKKVLVIGDSGAGKSSLINHLYTSGNAYELDYLERTGEYCLKEKQGVTLPLKVGHGARSETLFSRVVITKNNHVYCDSPGFNHSYADEELCASLGVPMASHFFEQFNAVLIVISWADLQNQRASAFINLTRTLSAIFHDITNVVEIKSQKPIPLLFVLSKPSRPVEMPTRKIKKISSFRVVSQFVNKVSDILKDMDSESLTKKIEKLEEEREELESFEHGELKDDWNKNEILEQELEQLREKHGKGEIISIEKVRAMASSFMGFVRKAGKVFTRNEQFSDVTKGSSGNDLLMDNSHEKQAWPLSFFEKELQQAQQGYRLKKDEFDARKKKFESNYKKAMYERHSIDLMKLIVERANFCSKKEYKHLNNIFIFRGYENEHEEDDRKKIESYVEMLYENEISLKKSSFLFDPTAPVFSKVSDYVNQFVRNANENFTKLNEGIAHIVTNVNNFETQREEEKDLKSTLKSLYEYDRFTNNTASKVIDQQIKERVEIYEKRITEKKEALRSVGNELELLHQEKNNFEEKESDIYELGSYVSVCTNAWKESNRAISWMGYVFSPYKEYENKTWEYEGIDGEIKQYKPKIKHMILSCVDDKARVVFPQTLMNNVSGALLRQKDFEALILVKENSDDLNLDETTGAKCLYPVTFIEPKAKDQRKGYFKINPISYRNEKEFSAYFQSYSMTSKSFVDVYIGMVLHTLYSETPEYRTSTNRLKRSIKKKNNQKSEYEQWIKEMRHAQQDDKQFLENKNIISGRIDTFKSHLRRLGIKKESFMKDFFNDYHGSKDYYGRIFKKSSINRAITSLESYHKHLASYLQFDERFWRKSPFALLASPWWVYCYSQPQVIGGRKDPLFMKNLLGHVKNRLKGTVYLKVKKEVYHFLEVQTVEAILESDHLLPNICESKTIEGDQQEDPLSLLETLPYEFWVLEYYLVKNNSIANFNQAFTGYLEEYDQNGHQKWNSEQSEIFSNCDDENSPTDLFIQRKTIKLFSVYFQSRIRDFNINKTYESKEQLDRLKNWLQSFLKKNMPEATFSSKREYDSILLNQALIFIDKKTVGFKTNRWFNKRETVNYENSQLFLLENLPYEFWVLESHLMQNQAIFELFLDKFTLYLNKNDANEGVKWYSQKYSNLFSIASRSSYGKFSAFDALKVSDFMASFCDYFKFKEFEKKRLLTTWLEDFLQINDLMSNLPARYHSTLLNSQIKFIGFKMIAFKSSKVNVFQVSILHNRSVKKEVAALVDDFNGNEKTTTFSVYQQGDPHQQFCRYESLNEMRFFKFLRRKSFSLGGLVKIVHSEVAENDASFGEIPKRLDDLKTKCMALIKAFNEGDDWSKKNQIKLSNSN